MDWFTGVVMLWDGSKTENALPFTPMAGCCSNVAVVVVRYICRAALEAPPPQAATHALSRPITMSRARCGAGWSAA